MILEVMDNPKGGFRSATDQYMIDQVVFGTSGTEIQKGTKRDKAKIKYRAYRLRNG